MQPYRNWSLGRATSPRPIRSDPPNPQVPLFDGQNLWISNFTTADVIKMRPRDGTILGSYPAGSGPSGIAYDGTNIWVADNAPNTVTKLRASDGSTIGTYPAGSYPVGCIFDGRDIWVSNAGDGTV